jgi:hypothetical protein
MKRFRCSSRLAVTCLALAPALLTAQSSEPEAQTQPDRPPAVILHATTVDGVRLYSRSADRVGAEGALDFGALPAGEFMHHMRFMSPLYTALVLVSNETGAPLRLERVEIGDVETSERENPFTTCGHPFRPYSLATGKRLAIGLCYHPATQTPSQAVARIHDDSGRIVAALELRGRGRALREGETPPMGLMGPDPVEDRGRKGHVEVRDGQLIEATTGRVFERQGEPVDEPQRRKEPCVVEIVGGGEIPDPTVAAVDPGSTAVNTGNLGLDQGVTGDEINVAQHVILDIEITCPDGTRPRPTAVLWTLGGDEIKDYAEEIRSGTVRQIPMDPADLTALPRDLYWKDTGTHRVECKVDFAWNGQALTANVVRDFVVERNATDIDRQMEDFYIWNHEAKVLKDHYSWHPSNPFGVCFSTGQADFFVFHRLMLGSAFAFRDTFGYGIVPYWDGTQALPVSPDSLHADRAPLAIPFSTPAWYTRFGNGDISPCHRAEKLADFPTAGALAEEMEGEWHGLGHVSVGGTMNSFNAPKDPVFFRWHKAIDNVYHNWRLITGQP